MKKSHLFIIVVLAVAVAIIVTTGNDASTYETFSQAAARAQNGNTNDIHVVGQLKKDAMGTIVGLREGADKVSMSFVLVDQNGREETVYYNQPMPTDLIKSEQVVVIGRFKDDHFVASKILLKCPSKYQEENKSLAS